MVSQNGNALSFQSPLQLESCLSAETKGTMCFLFLLTAVRIILTKWRAQTVGDTCIRSLDSRSNKQRKVHRITELSTSQYTRIHYEHFPLKKYLPPFTTRKTLKYYTTRPE